MTAPAQTPSGLVVFLPEERDVHGFCLDCGDALEPDGFWAFDSEAGLIQNPRSFCTPRCADSEPPA